MVKTSSRGKERMIERPDLEEWCVVESENHVPHICRTNVQDIGEDVDTAVDYNQVVDARLLFAKDHLDGDLGAWKNILKDVFLCEVFTSINLYCNTVDDKYSKKDEKVCQRIRNIPAIIVMMMVGRIG